MKYALFILASLVFSSAFAADKLSHVIADCKEADFVEYADPIVDIEFGSDRGYAHRCIKVHVGAVVSLPASDFHPLEAIADIDGRRNPFASGQPFYKSTGRSLNATGLYGFFCPVHGNSMGEGMAGVIWVVE